MEQTASETMGKRIAAHRKRLGLTQDQLAERVGVSPQAVSKWENDLSCPDISVLPLLAEIFGISTDELLGVAPKEAPARPGEIISREEENEPEGFHFNDGRWNIEVNTGMKGGIFFALWIVALGAMLLAGRLLKLDISFWTALWTTGLTALGIGSLFKKFNLLGLTAALGGAYFILNALKVIPAVLSWETVLPVLIIIWGLSLLVDAVTKKKNPIFSITHNGGPASRTGKQQINAEEGVFRYDNSFGEGDYLVELPLLRGGEISGSFGDHTIDLSGCQAVAENCRINVSNSFGELKLLVPRRFRVEVEASKSFAAMNVKGQADQDSEGVIYLDVSINFGEMTIRYI